LNKNEFAELFQSLEQSFDALPGVGPKAAKRLARHVFNQASTGELADCLQSAQKFTHCEYCRMPVRTSCDGCRDAISNELLVVEQADQAVFWQANGFTGRVFVLHGLLSPAAGCGPTELGLAQLKRLTAQLQPVAVWLQLEGGVEAQVTEQFIRNLLPEMSLRSWSVDDFLQHLNTNGVKSSD
jgi:recombination protein RecR